MIKTGALQAPLRCFYNVGYAHQRSTPWRFSTHRRQRPYSRTYIRTLWTAGE